MYIVMGQLLGLLIGPIVSLVLFGDAIWGITFGPLIGFTLWIIATSCFGKPKVKGQDEEPKTM